MMTEETAAMRNKQHDNEVQPQPKHNANTHNTDNQQQSTTLTKS